MIDFTLMETDASAIGSHIEKWLAREPEMRPVLAFAGTGKHRAMLWGALLNEWLEATFELSDAGVAQVKLAWWGDAAPERMAFAIAIALFLVFTDRGNLLQIRLAERQDLGSRGGAFGDAGACHRVGHDQAFA